MVLPSSTEIWGKSVMGVQSPDLTSKLTDRHQDDYFINIIVVLLLTSSENFEIILGSMQPLGGGDKRDLIKKCSFKKK